ncbi:MAG: IS200/IS605 family transposase [Armatimonadetes bacterium]|nr:IS200/IS605 family transposase [Armatimonadota bacterium]
MANATCQHDEHRVHLLMYHLIFCPKRRKKVLVGDVARDLDALVREKCAEKGWTVHELAIQPDHVYLFVQVNPEDSASDVLRHVKGYTSHTLRLRYPELKKLPSLWTRSSFSATAGNVSQATIQRYIAAQRGM